MRCLRPVHELAICQALIGQVAEVARERQAVAVTDIYVSVGPLSGVEGTLMQSAFPLAAAGTVANEATLHLQATAIRISCEECGEESEAIMNRLLCEHCGHWRTRVISGDELMLQRVVLDGTGAGGQVHV